MARSYASRKVGRQCRGAQAERPAGARALDRVRPDAGDIFIAFVLSA